MIPTLIRAAVTDLAETKAVGILRKPNKLLKGSGIAKRLAGPAQPKVTRIPVGEPCLKNSCLSKSLQPAFSMAERNLSFL